MRGRKCPTRRRKALRWLTLLVHLTAFLTLHGQYHFLRIRGIREAEWQGGIGPTEFVAELPRDGYHEVEVRANEKGMIAASFRIMTDGVRVGWGAWYTSYLDCSGSEPFYVGFCIHDNDCSATDEDLYVVGRLLWPYQRFCGCYCPDRHIQERKPERNSYGWKRRLDRGQMRRDAVYIAGSLF